ncbi:MAG TPA: hypothetical protein VNG90_04055 [Candidatus Acidoferrum sp.]|nr:hypothetical protein [Candidatus Acidoferrum sp.]
MPIVSLFSWWYGDGWSRLLHWLLEFIARVFEAFSILLLVKTLFSPFRQISVGEVRGSLDVKMRAWLDLQISRLIGAMVRLAVIAVGLLAVLLSLIGGVLTLIFWPLIPALPIITILLILGTVR